MGSGRRSSTSRTRPRSGPARARRASPAPRRARGRARRGGCRARARAARRATRRAPRAPLGELLRGLRVLADAVLGQPQLQRDRDQALLRAVVQIALDAPPRRIAGRDDAFARGRQLLDARLELRLQPLALERHVGGRANDLEQLRLVGQRGVVDERGDVVAVVVDRGHRAPRAIRRQRARARRSHPHSTRSPAANRRARATGRGAHWTALAEPLRDPAPAEARRQGRPSRHARAAAAGCPNRNASGIETSRITVICWPARMNSPGRGRSRPARRARAASEPTSVGSSSRRSGGAARSQRETPTTASASPIVALNRTRSGRSR